MKRLVIVLVLTLAFAVSVTAAEAKASKTVSRHGFTSKIEDREPVDVLVAYAPVDEGIIYYFTELNNMTDDTVKHVWYKNNDTVFERDIEIKGPRWRYSTSMKSGHFKKGDTIKVEVIDANGNVLASDTINVE